ncbi:hypothetical protein M231_06893 [Tremella mesenterica]|uniref:Uncharacterized protein n=1 Tax=Tremella mesenterica TaxID=5217 RepID=A0A4Q1BET9_TREME|nr:hypothetical protein M231_06893 [Tremella mesenterica]
MARSLVSSSPARPSVLPAKTAGSTDASASLVFGGEANFTFTLRYDFNNHVVVYTEGPWRNHAVVHGLALAALRVLTRNGTMVTVRQFKAQLRSLCESSFPQTLISVVDERVEPRS